MSPSFIITVILVFAFFPRHANSIAPVGHFNDYTYMDHPIYRTWNTSQLYPHGEPSPVVMKKYFYKLRGQRFSEKSLFVPNAVSYVNAVNGSKVFSTADAFLPRVTAIDETNTKSFVEVHLNGPARAFVIFSGRDGRVEAGRADPTLEGRFLYNISKPVGLLLNTSSTEHAVGSRLSSASDRMGRKFNIPTTAVMVEVAVSSFYTISVPHPNSVQLGAHPAHNMMLVLVRNQTSTAGHFESFDYPRLPHPFRQMDTDHLANESTSLVNPADDPPLPNDYCPDWLHDMYISQSQHPLSKRQSDEPRFWKTWHPIVDPVFWCYFRHEHGSFPGGYLPRFGYTAYHTADATSPTGRQMESHEGFKVFRADVPNTDRAVVITVHAHLSSARRVSVRHHTCIFAVLKVGQDGRWSLEMELSFKMDFGAAKATLRNQTTFPVDASQMAIDDSLVHRGIRAGRRFNVLDLSSFPSSVNRSLLLRSPVSAGRSSVSRGVYELWNGPIKTCSAPASTARGVLDKGFTFQFRDAATAIRAPTAGRAVKLQELAGKSIIRAMRIMDGGMSIGLRNCVSSIFPSERASDLRALNGVFFTDTYLQYTKNDGSAFSAQQFIHPDVQDLLLPEGLYTMVDGWTGMYGYRADGETIARGQDIEGAVRKEDN